MQHLAEERVESLMKLLKGMWGKGTSLLLGKDHLHGYVATHSNRKGYRMTWASSPSKVPRNSDVRA